VLGAAVKKPVKADDGGVAMTREWKALYEAEKALTDRLSQEHAAERHGLLVRIAELRTALRAVMDAWSGDMHPDLAAEVYSAIARSAPDHVADSARAEVQDLLRRAAKVPGLTAALDEARGVAGDRCEVGNNCGRAGCPECQQ
jgi:hypothetical protein